MTIALEEEKLFKKASKAKAIALENWAEITVRVCPDDYQFCMYL